jgi:hypothetical protein
MAELFRYIEQSFVVPLDTAVIDTARESDLQNALREALAEPQSPEQIRDVASNFLLEHISSPVSDPFSLGKQLSAFGNRLRELPSAGADAIEKLIREIFDSDASDLVSSTPFQSDKALLDDVLVCVKITTAFDRVNAGALVSMRQTIAFLEDFAAGKMIAVTTEGVRTSLRRPVRIPSEFVKPLPVNPEPPEQPSVTDPQARQRADLATEQQHLKRAYEVIMALQPGELELKPSRLAAGRPTMIATHTYERSSGTEASFGERLLALFDRRAESGTATDAVAATPTVLAIPHAAIERLGWDVRNTLEKANIDVAGTSVPEVIAAIKREWQDVSRQLAPYQVPAPAKIFRVGVHLFAVSDAASTTVSRTKEA